jgi:HD-GYP domain-containing protein (c-di-GMP phosphodiesterase class II)
MGLRIGLNNQKIIDLGLGSLLHDVGKTHLPIEILNKPGPLTGEEFQVVKTHAREGFEVLKLCDDLGPLARSISLQHHERFDGSGYPRHLAGDDITYLARLVGAIDVYDALTSERVYRTAYPNHIALKQFLYKGNPAFDPNIIKYVHMVVCPYPPGTIVRLSNGEIAVVAAVNEKDLYKPNVICVGADGRGKGIKVDLLKEPDIDIVGTTELRLD